MAALTLAGGQIAEVGTFVAAMLGGIMLSWLLAPSKEGADVAAAGAQA